MSILSIVCVIVRATRRGLWYVCVKRLSAEWLSRLKFVSGQRALATSKINLRASFALQYPEKWSKYTWNVGDKHRVGRYTDDKHNACEHVLARTCSAFVKTPQVPKKKERTRHIPYSPLSAQTHQNSTFHHHLHLLPWSFYQLFVGVVDPK